MRVLNHCAARSGQELNVGSIAQAAKLARRTVTNYLEWLVSAHLITVVPPLGKILANRQIKSPKLLVSDSGLACHLAGSDAHGLAQRCDALRSQALETFVGNELFRQLGWSRTRARLRHWRVIQGAEVDFVLETSDGRVVGIEVEATTSPGRNAARRLGRLRDATVRRGGSFEHGYVLHLGRSSVHLGDRISAVPVAALWSTPQLPDDLTLIADATVRQAHTDTVVADLPLPALPAITIRIQPRNPREIRGFEFETLMVAGRLAQISELYPPVWDRIKVFRDYLGYRVVSDPGGDKELTVARLGLDGSGGIAVRVPGEPDHPESRSRAQPDRIRPTDVYLALAAGCAALRAWTAGMTAVGGKAILSAQLIAPQSGIGLSVGPPQETLGPDPGTRIVKSDLGPLATEVDLEDWKSNAAQMMRSVRFLGEHLLAAFGYEGPGPVDDAGRFTEAGIEPEPRESLADTARLLGIECDWTNASVR